MIGFGNVGRSFAEIVNERADQLKKIYGITPQVVAIADRGGAIVNDDGVDLGEALSIRKSADSVAAHMTLGQRGKSALAVIESVDADVLLELTTTIIPDGEPGLTHIESALKKGLHVVTTNKGPLATAMPALLELAQYQGVHLKFSGAVGGGTPILSFAKESLVGEKIESIEGILNGTTNYILTRMFEAGITIEEALKEAFEAGYAEADPSYDINGLDTAAKLVILCNWIMGRNVSIRDVDMEGISNVTVQDVEKAKRLGKAIKLVGRINGSVMSVGPSPVPLDNPLCVKGALNAILFRTELAGDIILTGRGAGGRETASAVLRDIIDIKKTMLK